ncbi:hypothetical protein CHARACLAT_023918 [Characodon lateralis]|uniref:Uncharacterized protein n=1 Tax=Characodon lateralis TaxID=208331 RepID=A0ABU7D0Y4_9TELE|nr:hypothetical protein [Characodon lateralis]
MKRKGKNPPQSQCRSPRELQRQAHRHRHLHCNRSSHGPRDPRPGTHNSPSRGPTESRGPDPSKQPPEVSRHTKAPSSGHENHKYTSRQKHQPLAGSVEKIGPTARRGSKPKTQPDTKRGTHSHNHTFPPSCIHIKTLTPTEPT